jgi:hypothetical protein
MRRRAVQTDSAEDQVNRFAWWASFLVTLVVVGLLCIAHSAQARPLAPALPGATALAVFDEESGFEDEEEWEEEDEECVWDEEEEELWCDDEREEAEAAAEAAECIVTDVEARVAARPSRDRLELTVRYEAEHAAAVSIRWRLRGGKGALSLGTERARFSRAGTFRHLELNLNDKQMSRALAAREFRVEVRAVNTPGHCKSELQSRLSAKHGAAKAPTWTERRSRRG